MSDFVTPQTAARQASLSITNSLSLLKLMSIKSVMPSNHLILCHPLLLLPSIFPSIKVFSNELTLLIRWPRYWSFSFSNSPPMNIQDWLPLGLTGLVSLQSKGLSRVFSNTTVWSQLLGLQIFIRVVEKGHSPDSQILKTSLWLPKGKCVAGEGIKSGEWDEHTHTTIYKTGNQQRPTV